MSQYCCTPECDKELSPNSKLDQCPLCRASIGMWKKRGVRAVLERRARLRKYDARMETIVTPKSVPALAKKKMVSK